MGAKQTAIGRSRSSHRRSLSVRRWWRTGTPAENPLQPPENTGDHVEQSDHKKHEARKEKDGSKKRSQKKNQPKGMAGMEIDDLQAVKAPRAHHQVADRGHHAH